MPGFCLDKFVITPELLGEKIMNPKDELKTCDYWEKKVENKFWNTVKNPTDVLGNASPFNGCCSSSGSTQKVDEIDSIKKINDMIKNKKDNFKNTYKEMNAEFTKFKDPEIPKTDDDYDIMITKIKNVWRLFIGNKLDSEKIKRLHDFQSRSSQRTIVADIADFDDKTNTLKNFRDDGSKERKIQYFDKNTYALYETFFYTMLSIISIVFIRNQIQK
tara:strand:- start:10 stop:660 length:651 start_codon:yes stop_codon:yes gene_type:complete